MFAFLLAADNVDLALSELKGALNAEVGSYRIKREGRVALVDGISRRDAECVVRRLARTHAVYEIGHGPSKLKIGGEEVPADMIARREKLSHRKPHKRPEFMPDSTEPFLARTLVNLAEGRRGERFLDPMCNVGGILIEAGLIGCIPVGVDVRANLVERAERNLEHYGITEYELHVGRAENVDDILNEGVQAAAVDPPYGRGSYVEGGPVDKLVLETLEALFEVVEGKVALSVPKKVWREISGSLHVETVVKDRVHRSLTRVIAVITG
ncbi:TRM11 family methyltransferase [Methanopyrus sp. KOL6]|uniref:TRM11 family SAM-dependent methyltransferase n=1 Tax=Methanopyrus sp. KOL6 TaxID=1937004 RepID=UPI000B4BF91A|nr:hypothetical protein [Methanopyrus sp. KOL6]